MAITEIDTATPTVGLKAGADIINGNFTDSTNAASHLVQASASDTTANRVVTTDSFEDNGGIILTTGVTNLDVFGGTSIGDTVAYGGMVSGSVAVFPLPISSLSEAVSVTVVNTFNVTDLNGSTITGGGAITPSFNAGSGNKICLITVAGLTSTTDKPLLLQQVAAASKITVNF